MQFSFANVCLFALAATSSVFAQTAGFDTITSPTNGQVLTPGSTFQIVWTPSAPAGPISIILLQGQSNTTLQKGATIASGIDSTKGTFDWTVPTAQTPVYGLLLQLDSTPSTFQYSFPFSISGGASGTGTGITTTATTTGTSTSTATTTVKVSCASNQSCPQPTSSSTSTSDTSTSTVTAVTTSVSSSNSTTTAKTSSSASKTSSASSTSSPTPNSGAVIGGTAVMGAFMWSMALLL